MTPNHTTRWNNLTTWLWRDCDPDSGGCITYAQLPAAASPHCAWLSAIRKQHHILASLCGCSICSTLLRGDDSHRKCKRESRARRQGLPSVGYIIKTLVVTRLSKIWSGCFSKLWPQMKQKNKVVMFKSCGFYSALSDSLWGQQKCAQKKW